MLKEAENFWASISTKVRGQINADTKNAFRCERYDVTTAPSNGKIGVTLPMGDNEIFIPHSAEVAGASVGDTVLVIWWGSMSNGKAYFYGNGYSGGSSKGYITTTTTWTAGTDEYTQTVTVSGCSVSASSKVDLQPDKTAIVQLATDGITALFVENNSGTLTLHALGTAPTVSLTIQCVVTEVS